MARYTKLTGQILSLLVNGILLGYSRDRQNRNEILKECDKIWLSIDRNQLFHILRLLKISKFIATTERQDGSKIVRLTEKGRDKSRRLMLVTLAIKKPQKWDKKWHFVIFDIPEEKKKLRDALRRQLKLLGFCEFQKSVFVFPYPCEDEINILVNFFRLHENVRHLEATLSYDADLRKLFSL